MDRTEAGGAAERRYDALIIGAGPAGVSAAIYLLRAGFSVGLLTRDNGSLSKAGRIGNYYGLEQPLSGSELAERGHTQAEELGGELLHGDLTAVSWDGEYHIETARHSLTAPVLIIACGAARRSVGISGLERFEGHGVSYCAVCDGFFFRGQTVALLGTGDYARHELNELLPLVGKVLLLSNGEPLSFELPERCELIETPVAELLSRSTLMGEALRGVRFADGREEECAALFVAQDTPDGSGLARRLGLKTQDGRIVVGEDMSTAVPGLFAAGDCVSRVRQIAVAAGQGVTAGLSAVAYLRGLKKNAAE